MNRAIKHLLDSYNITPPHTVQTEEDVVEYLLELLEEKRFLIETIHMVTPQRKYIDYSQQSLLS